MKPLRVVTVDDEPLARERVASLVGATEGLELSGEARNGLEALDLIARLEPDLLFLDVEMPQLSGFGVVTALEAHRLPAVVFLTAYDHYAVQAFDVGAVDYLLKPVAPARFAAAVDRARLRLESGSTDPAAVVATSIAAERTRGPRKRYVVRLGYAHHFVAVPEIDWVEAADNYLRLHVGVQAHLARGTIKDAEAELDPDRFVRIHRSAIVAVDRIASTRRLESGGYLVTLTGGAELRASRQYVDRIKRLLERSG
ncbi:MAG: LytR/AlgR family response regulator transcription factor [Gemmatimonadales bacterium]